MSFDIDAIVEKVMNHEKTSEAFKFNIDALTHVHLNIAKLVGNFAQYEEEFNKLSLRILELERKNKE